jgi:PhoH-like ATPase
MAKKIFLLDTNVLIHNPRALFSFDDSDVALAAISLEQLDKFKKEGTDRGRNARETIRLLDALREEGQLGTGIKLKNGGVLKVVFAPTFNQPADFPFKITIEDNEILLIARTLQQEGYEVIFISKDLNARVKAEILGIHSEDYLKEYVSQEEFYKGWTNLAVPAVQLKKNEPQELLQLAEGGGLVINEFVILESQNNPHQYRVFRYLGGKRFIDVQEPSLQWPLKARNAQQLMALNLLLDPAISFVTLFGPAGTGKTFLALLAGLHKVLIEDEFEKILVARPVVPLGRDIGYLPGTLQEKLYTWMLPIYDNMELIGHSAALTKHVKEVNRYADERGGHHRSQMQRGHKRGKHGGKWDRGGNDHRYDASHNNHGKHNHMSERSMEKGSLVPLDELMQRGKISLEAITYMRGRSIPFQYILIDEVQNLTQHEVKTLITRVGEGSKIILTGDPYQIDSPYLDFSTNGLVVTSEKFKGQSLFGTVYLQTSERSLLSKLATELL